MDGDGIESRFLRRRGLAVPIIFGLSPLPLRVALLRNGQELGQFRHRQSRLGRDELLVLFIPAKERRLMPPQLA